MRLSKLLNESKITMKMANTPYGKVRVIENYKDYKRLYVLKKGKHGYAITDKLPMDIDSMVKIGEDYWFGTLKKIKEALGI
jgi:hypothetical protein